ncbi:hypothetical protein DM01DRAFT_1370790 [Hesseltinella vesiculosa]|uniref:TPR-like protein n=1 Tax=Hesseltinella vesiculosa TaxID=101127 RepID=A0A1X2GUS4_9FUNG|nr:hypothetical protein DM01DRAFT_1370790 [Hesseltinella vesiculosa]
MKKQSQPHEPILSSHYLAKTVASYCKSGLVDEAQCTLQRAIQSSSPPTTAHAYNHLFKALAKQFDNPDRKQQALDLYQLMLRQGVAPTSQTYIQLILGLIHQQHTQSLPSHDSIHSLLLGFLSMEAQKHYKRTSHKLSILVKSMGGNPNLVDTIASTLLTTHKAGAHLDASVWNVGLYNCLKHRRFDLADQLFANMTPDLTSYHLLLGALLGQRLTPSGFSLRPIPTRHRRKHNLQKAIHLFQSMLHHQLTPSPDVYRAFLSCHMTATPLDIPTLQRLWQAWLTSSSAQLERETSWITPLMDSYLRHDATQAVNELYWDMRQHNLALDASLLPLISGAIIRSANRQQLFTSVAMYCDLISHGHVMPPRTASALLHASINRGQLELTRQLLLVAPSTIPSALHAAVIRAHIDQRQYDHAQQLFDDAVQQFSAKSSDREGLLMAHCSMVQGHLDRRQWARAQELFRSFMDLLTDDQSRKIPRIMANVWIEGFARQVDHELETSTKANLDTLGVNPISEHPSTANLWIRALLQNGRYMAARQDLDTAVNLHGSDSLRSAIQDLADQAALMGKVDDCETWTRALTRPEDVPKSFEARLICYGQAGDLDKLHQVYHDVNERGISMAPTLENKVRQWLALK